MTDTKGKGPVIRALRIIETLAANAADGLTVKALSGYFDVPPSTICRDLNMLAKEGWCERLPTGSYTLAIKPLSISISWTVSIEERKKKYSAFFQRALKEAPHAN